MPFGGSPPRRGVDGWSDFDWLEPRAGGCRSARAQVRGAMSTGGYRAVNIPCDSRARFRGVNGGGRSTSCPLGLVCPRSPVSAATFGSSEHDTFHPAVERPGRVRSRDFRSCPALARGLIGTQQVPTDVGGPSRGHVWLAPPSHGTCDVPAAHVIACVPAGREGGRARAARAEACGPARLRERVRPGGETRTRRRGRCG